MRFLQSEMMIFISKPIESVQIQNISPPTGSSDRQLEPHCSKSWKTRGYSSRAEGALRSTATSETERVSSSLCKVSTGYLKSVIESKYIDTIERRLFGQIQKLSALIIFKSAKLNLWALGRKIDLI